jgi:hypothetical protein
MSFSTDINIKDNATPALEAQVSRLEPRFVNRIAGRAGTNLVRAHLFKYNAEHPNQLGGKRTNFYAQAKRIRGTTFISDDSKAVISINQVGIRQRWLGGEIKPTGTNPRTGQPIKYLAIPARAEAYGRRAGNWIIFRFSGERMDLSRLWKIWRPRSGARRRALSRREKRAERSITGLCRAWFSRAIRA